MTVPSPPVIIAKGTVPGAPGVGGRDPYTVNHQQIWWRATVGIHVQLFAPNHLVLRPSLAFSYAEWGSFRCSIKELSFVCFAIPSVSDLVAVPRGVGSGDRPQLVVAVEGDLMGLGD